MEPGEGEARVPEEGKVVGSGRWDRGVELFRLKP